MRIKEGYRKNKYFDEKELFEKLKSLKDLEISGIGNKETENKKKRS